MRTRHAHPGNVDPFGRRINYLRLSVTGECNLRCAYCRPRGAEAAACGIDPISDAALLRVARAAVSLGIEKIRVTGGEPLLRTGILPLLSRLARIPGLVKLVLTTNGLRLAAMAQGLRAAGVDSVNVSLDSLRPDRFARITGGGDLRKVLAGIEAAQRFGFSSLKVNTVVMRGINEDELEAFAALTLDRPLRVRFIEFMPAASGGCSRGLTVPGEEILSRLSKRFRLRPAEKEPLAGPARYYRIEGAAGAVGVITPVSCHFCAECNRIRVTAAGMAKGCLFSSHDLDLTPFLRAKDGAGLRRALRSVVSGKPERHPLSPDGSGAGPFPMAAVGG